MASRQCSDQKYRLKQMQYIMQLETEVKALQVTKQKKIMIPLVDDFNM